MTTSRPIVIVRSWVGVLAAVIVLCTAAWLTGEYIHAVSVAPSDKALVESLKERARTDATGIGYTVQEFRNRRGVTSPGDLIEHRALISD